MTNKPLWKPSPAKLNAANMTQYINWLQHNKQLSLSGYGALHQWSIQNKAAFWDSIWEFCNIQASQPATQVITQETKMPGTKWFSGAKLNFAENLLKPTLDSNAKDNIALISYNELGEKRQLSYAELLYEVTKLATRLRQIGISAGDRITGIMPNTLETVIAMLATSSIGAIWSSCSPDFGSQGILDRFAQIRPKVIFSVNGYYYHGKTFLLQEKLEKVLAQLPDCQLLVITRFLKKDTPLPKIKHATFWDNFLSISPEPLTFTQLAFDHPLYILYSSGTTGAPKCIVHSAGGTLIQHLKELILHSNLTTNDTIFYFTTCSWMMWNWLISSLAIGATIVLYDGSPTFPNPHVLLKLIDQENITIFGTSARYLASIYKADIQPKQHHKLDSLQTILSTGSPLSADMFKVIYQQWKQDLCLSSISGGTDIVSCFALGNPILPVRAGELQCIGLGMDVYAYNENGEIIFDAPGELVCRSPFPAMPIEFWNDSDNKKFYQAYFSQFLSCWTQGDFITVTNHHESDNTVPYQSVVIHGRADTTLNVAGVRIGTAEIYRPLEQIEAVIEGVVVEQQWQDNSRLVLFVRLQDNLELTAALIKNIKQTLRTEASPRHVPSKIIQVADIPRTKSGKIVELAVKKVIHGETVINTNSLANPESLALFKNLTELEA